MLRSNCKGQKYRSISDSQKHGESYAAGNAVRSTRRQGKPQMKEAIIREVEQGMLEVLDNAQRAQLHRVLEHALFGATVVRDDSVRREEA